MTLPPVLALLALLPPLVAAHDNGMDMSMDGAMNLTSGDMVPYFHFTGGDVLWFQGWVPTSAGTIVGTCIGLFLLAIIDRWIAACRGLMEAHWRKQALLILANKANAPHDARVSSSSVLKAGEAGAAVPKPSRAVSDDVHPSRTLMPFIPAHDIPRAVIYTGQAALGYAFMLAVMTYHVGFILAIVVGLGVGETLFGRYAAHAHLY